MHHHLMLTAEAQWCSILKMTELSVYRGDDKTWNLNFTDANGDPIDLTGATVFFTIKVNKTDKDSDAIISKDQSSHVDAVNGQTTISLTDSDTDVRVGNYHYDIQLVDSLGIVTTIVVGAFKVKQEVTTRIS